MSWLVSGVPAEGLRGVLEKIECSPDIPKVKSMIIDTFMFFAHEVANEMGISWVTLFTSGAAVMIAFMQYDELVNRGHFSLKGNTNTQILIHSFELELLYLRGRTGFNDKTK